jgi:Asp-tRNA(Asn)/Glu-tRNA(Gln) amidotransferase A subunit family amidase
MCATAIVEQVRAREVSRREVLEAHLDRIDAIDGEIGAF